MDDLIRQIYGGFDQFPADLIGIDSPKFIHNRDVCHMRYETFRSRLPQELQKDFDNLMDALTESIGLWAGRRICIRF